jgi:hypothetical protein
LTSPASGPPSRGAQLLAELRAWLKPRLAQIVEIRAPRDVADGTERTERTVRTDRTDRTDRIDTA